MDYEKAEKFLIAEAAAYPDVTESPVTPNETVNNTACGKDYQSDVVASKKDANSTISDLGYVMIFLSLVLTVFCFCGALYGYYRFKSTNSSRESETRLRESEERYKLLFRKHEDMMRTQNTNQFAMQQGQQTHQQPQQTFQPPSHHQMPQQQRLLPGPLNNEYREVNPNASMKVVQDNTLEGAPMYNIGQVYNAQDSNRPHQVYNAPAMNTQQQQEGVQLVKQ